MDNFKKSIDKQIASNQGKNLFPEGATQTLQFIQGTKNAIETAGDFPEEQVNVLIDYATDKALQEFCRVNQYYTFNSGSRQLLRDKYAELFLNIRNKKVSAESIREIHFRNLQKWLQQTNPFAEKLYLLIEEELKPVPCAEYSAAFQLEILQLDLSRIPEPVLDIGCGRQGNLVKYLRGEGIEAVGFDRLPDDLTYLTSADWSEYDYGTSKWGTIISNLGFSNHFHHHHVREDGDFLKYAKTYMEILRSLKPGGCFHYAPDLPFIEVYLSSDLYQLSNQSIVKESFKSTKVKRL
jgi:hypothetical protein